MQPADEEIISTKVVEEITSGPRCFDAPHPGRYRHYKGNYYEVLETARHSETEELLVVYRALYGDHSLWVRPLAMFIEKIVVDGQEVPRFAYCNKGV